MTTTTVIDSPFASTMALADVTADYFRQHYLTGLVFCGSDGQPLPDAFFVDKIATSISKFEAISSVDVLKRLVVDERHDYHTTDYRNYAFLQLFRIPAISVQEIRAVYPTGQTIQIYPAEWVRLEQCHSQVHLVPTSGTLSQVLISGSGYYLPFIAGPVYLPQLWAVDYTSGFDPTAVPREVVDAVLKYAAVELLQMLSDLVGPLGVASSSLGVDGLSQSTSRQLPAFKARIDAYRRDLGLDTPDFKGGMIQQLRRTYSGILLTSV